MENRIRFESGGVYSAEYPSASRKSWERRQFRVLRTRKIRIDAGSNVEVTLVIAIDLVRGQERTFCAESMREIRLEGIAPENEADHTYSVGVIDVDELEIAEAGLDRESADGFAFGFNGQAVADGSNVRAIVIADCDT